MKSCRGQTRGGKWKVKAAAAAAGGRRERALAVRSSACCAGQVGSRRGTGKNRVVFRLFYMRVPAAAMSGAGRCSKRATGSGGLYAGESVEMRESSERRAGARSPEGAVCSRYAAKRSPAQYAAAQRSYITLRKVRYSRAADCRIAVGVRCRTQEWSQANEGRKWCGGSVPDAGSV